MMKSSHSWMRITKVLAITSSAFLDGVSGQHGNAAGRFDLLTLFFVYSDASYPATSSFPCVECLVAEGSPYHGEKYFFLFKFNLPSAKWADR